MHIESHVTATSGRSPAIRVQSGPMTRVAELVANHHDIAMPMILNTSRCKKGVARARQLAMYLSHIMLGESLTAVGQAFGRDRTTVSYACALIEDMRDDPAFDAEVSGLEAALEGVRS